MSNLPQQINEAIAYIQSKFSESPSIGMMLGSGLGIVADQIENGISIPYEEIPHFPVSSVEGHKGNLVLGQLEGKTVVAMQGRVHYYEGQGMQKITFPVRVMKALGAKLLMVTTACGGLNKDFYPGAFMLIRDHINFMGANPLLGKNHDELGPRFPDMSEIYAPRHLAVAKSVAQSQGTEIFEGVYAAVSGPYYLSKSELRFLQFAEADTVGMSVIPETIVAVHAGMEVLGIGCVTDMALPDQLEPPTHEEVMAVATKMRPSFVRLVRGIVGKL